MCDLKGLQDAELSMLKEFISVCEKHGLKYYLIGGTCLGAIRHGGFIPWDDDIDVALPREYYEKFIKIAEPSLPEYYFLQTFETDKEYPNCFAKIRDSRTTFIESSVKNLKINHGAYIDIFPLDYYPEKNGKIFELKVFIAKARLSAVFSSTTSLKMRAVQLLAKILHPSFIKTLHSLNSFVKSFSKADYYVNAFGTTGRPKKIPIECFGDGTSVKFEGIDAIVPSDYKNYLEIIYGDYMTPPPPEKQICHHFAEVIDIDKPYTSYI